MATCMDAAAQASATPVRSTQRRTSARRARAISGSSPGRTRKPMRRKVPATWSNRVPRRNITFTVERPMSRSARRMRGSASGTRSTSQAQAEQVTPSRRNSTASASGPAERTKRLTAASVAKGSRSGIAKAATPLPTRRV